MSDLNELLETAETIRTNVLPESNTHELIGGHLKNIINYFESKKISTEKIVSTKGNETTAVMSQKSVTDELNKKQDTLKSGTNIKTINGQSVLGAGDLEIETGSSSYIVPLSTPEETEEWAKSVFGDYTGTPANHPVYVAMKSHTPITFLYTPSNAIQYAATLTATVSTGLTFILSIIAGLKLYVVRIGYSSGGTYTVTIQKEVTIDNVPEIVQTTGSSTTTVMSQKSVTDELNKKQATLKSGSNIKTINGQSVLGSGDIKIEAGSDVSVVQTTGGSTTAVMSQKAVTDELSSKMTSSQVTAAIEGYLQYFLNNNFVSLEDLSVSDSIGDIPNILNIPQADDIFEKLDGNYVGRIIINSSAAEDGTNELTRAINYILTSSKQEWTGGSLYGSSYISYSNVIIACEKSKGIGTDDTKLRFFKRTVRYNSVDGEPTDIAYKGAWKEFNLGSGSNINVVQEKGESTTDVMSQKAVTDAINSISVAGTSIPVSGIMNLTSASTAIQLGTIYAGLANNTLRFYVVGDSSGTVPSDETYVTVNSAVKTLISAGGASVGDILIVGKLTNKPVYKLLPLNDAKAANGNFPGADGLETVWDKTQINKIAGIEATANANNSATRDGGNMNDCLQTGFYPWCTLGRPSGATGAFSLVVRRSTTPDFNGNYTVEQTCFGREAELGQIYTRLIFDKGDGSAAEYMDWKRIDRSDINVVQETGTSITSVMSQDAVTKAINSSKGIILEQLDLDALSNYVSSREDVISILGYETEFQEKMQKNKKGELFFMFDGNIINTIYSGQSVTFIINQWDDSGGFMFVHVDVEMKQNLWTGNVTLKGYQPQLTEITG